MTSELRPITLLESQVFEDALIRPRFAVLRLVLDLSEYGFMCSCSETRLGVRVAVYSAIYGLNLGYGWGIELRFRVQSLEGDSLVFVLQW